MICPAISSAGRAKVIVLRIARFFGMVKAIFDQWNLTMRKLFGFLVVLSILSGGAFLKWPGPITAHWNAWMARAEHQVALELATLDQIRSGKLKIGAAPAPPRAGTQPSVTQPSVTKATPAPLIGHDKVQKSEKKRAVKSAPPPPPIVIVKQPQTIPDSQQSMPVKAVAPEGTEPEVALGAILKHEIRENQAKEDTFWTEKRIQEALKNGEPKSRSAPCIAFCDKNNTTD